MPPTSERRIPTGVTNTGIPTLTWADSRAERNTAPELVGQRFPAQQKQRITFRDAFTVIGNHLTDVNIVTAKTKPLEII